MRIRGLWRLRKAAKSAENRWMNARDEPRSLILMYHRVLDASTSICGTVVSTSNFREHLDVIAEVGTPMTLDRCVAGLAEGKIVDRGIVLTFDDGYVDSSTVVAPLLAAVGLRATFYVPGSPTRPDEGFWWDEASEICFQTPKLPSYLRVTVNGRALEWTEEWGPALDLALNPVWHVGQPAPPTPRHRLFRSLYGEFIRLRLDEQRNVVRQLREQCGEPAGCGESRLNAKQLQGLCTAGHTIGAHTLSHRPLDSGSRDEARNDIVHNRVELEATLKAPVETFAYPFGLFDRRTVREVRRLGFTSACTSDEGAVWRYSDPLQLPRLTIPNEDGGAFRKRLLRYLRTTNRASDSTAASSITASACGDNLHERLRSTG